MALAVGFWAWSRPQPSQMAFVPLTLCALLAFQLVPLPNGMLSTIAPLSEAAWKLAGVESGWGTISVDPATTASGICRMLLALATLLVAADLGGQAAFRRTLAMTCAVVCGSIWLLGLIFPFDKSLVLLGFIDCRGPIEAEFWKTPLVPAIATNGSGNLDWVSVGGERYQTAMWIAADGFGPYIYANHFAGAMCMTLPVAVGWWLAVSRGRLPAIVRYGGAASAAVGGLWTVGVAATSRAGAAAIFMAALVFLSLALRPGWLRLAARGVVCIYSMFLGAFTLAMLGAFEGFERLFPLAIQPKIVGLLADGRAVAGRLALRMFAASPFMGSGLGTFGELFPSYRRDDLLLNYAHNDYAQWLAETGLVGGGILIGIIVWLGIRLRRQWQSLFHAGQAFAAGPWAALAGLAVHSAFDWNLHIPANAVIACLVAGLAAGGLGTAPTVAAQPRSAAGLPSRFRFPSSGFWLAAACIGAVAMLARDAVSETAQRRLREAIVEARLADMDSARPDAAPALVAALDWGARMRKWAPDNAQLALLLGQASLHLAAGNQPIDDAGAQKAAAEFWFGQARRNCAVCRGLPEQIPPARSSNPR